MSPVFEGLESGKTPREGSEQFEQFGTAVTTAAIAIVSKSGISGCPLAGFQKSREGLGNDRLGQTFEVTRTQLALAGVVPKRCPSAKTTSRPRNRVNSNAWRVNYPDTRRNG